MQIQISVIIPAYNREATIERCIRSVMNQVVRPFEVIMIDDGSVDRTIELAENMGCDMLRVIRQNHKGAQAARNLGILNAKGNYITFLDSDDEWLPQMLERVVEILSGVGKRCVIYGDCFTCRDKQKRLWRLPGYSGNLYRFLLLHPGPTISMVVPRDILLKIGLLDEQITAYQEWDMAIRISRELEFIHIREPLFIYHIHDGGNISGSLDKNIKGYARIVRKFHGEIIAEHGLEGLYSHYQVLFGNCLECKSRQIAVVGFQMLCIQILLRIRCWVIKRT